MIESFTNATMKKYFGFGLKGKAILLPVLAMIIVIAARIILLNYVGVGTADGVVDKGLLLWVAIFVLADTIYWTALMCIYFVIYAKSLASMSLGDENFETHIRLKEFIWPLAGDAALSVVTLGIYLPWMITRMVRRLIDNTSLGVNFFAFKGRGGTLFSLLTLCLVLPIAALSAVAYLKGYSPTVMAMTDPNRFYIFMLGIELLVIIIAAMAQFFVIKWIANLTYGSRLVRVSARAFQSTMFVLGQILLCLLTLGLYAPAAYMRIYGYYARRMVVGREYIEERFDYRPRFWRDYFYILGQLLLTLVTLCIYIPWAYAGIMRRLLTQTGIEELPQCTRSMPSAIDK